MGLNDRQLRALRQAGEKGRITKREYVAAIACSDRTAKRDLLELVQKKILVKHGNTKGSWYELAGI
jgi:predicted HTH transcriptional regulator